MTLPEGMPEALGPLDKPEEVVWAGPADQPIVGGVFDEVTSTRAKEIIARYPQSRSALLPLLHLVQSVEGHVSQDGIRFCADALELTTAEVSAVVTFYTMYKRTPCGEHLVSVCTNTLCAALGGDAIYRRLQEKLGTDGEPLGHEETSADGAITLEHAECLAACDLAPVIQVNYEFYDNQDVDKAEVLVDALRRGEKPHPTRGAALTDFRTVELELAGIFPDLAASVEGLSEAPETLLGVTDGRRTRLGRTRHARHAPRPAGEEMTDPITPVLTRRWAEPRSWSIDTYERTGGYQAFRAALRADPDELIQLVKDSGLRGRGGAGFPTGMKWGFIPQGPTGAGAKPKYLVINADEGEPGTCKDIPTMMADPHSLIEGCIITCYAIRAHFCAIYVRGEALHPIRRLANAVREAYAKGYLGRDILGTGYDIDIVVHAGAGAYICGEETALLDSLEGRRGQPRLKPPFPATAGLYASPTVVNNVETIASVPFIVSGGSDWFRAMGTEKSPGPKIYSVSGHVERPGQIEAPLGTTLRQLLELCGGMKDGIPLKFWTPGGSSTPLFTAEHLDVPLDFEGAAAAGSMLGTTAVQVFNETVSVPWAVMKWTEFYKHESCGKCTPCREGTYWLLQILERMLHHEGTEEDIETMLDICDNILGRSFCALGDGATSPITSGIQYFRQEFLDLCAEQPAAKMSAEPAGAMA